MDDPEADPREIARAFRFIRWVNRRLGGTAGLLRPLDARREAWGDSLSMLDVGTGCADIPIAAVEWGRRHGIEVRVVGVDLLEASLDEARRELRAHGLEPGEALDARHPVRLLRADAFDLERHFPPRSFDVVHAGMFLHHFPDEQGAVLLAIMGRLARRLVIWNDLSRDRWSRFAVRVITLPFPRIVRHDAVLSADKGFLERDVRALIGRAGLPAPMFRRWRWLGRCSAAIPIG